MNLFVILDEDGKFIDIKKSELAAQKYISDEIENGFDFGYKIELFDLDMSIEEHENIIDNSILGHCIECDEPLTNNNVRYNSSNEPFWCAKCYPNNY